MPSSRPARWRLALIVGGIVAAIGGPLHPEADASGTLREELATMTAGDTWVLSHSLIAVGTILITVGLWLAHRERAWPAIDTGVARTAAVAMSLYSVETLFHLAAAVDAAALAAGDAAPVAFTHVGLALPMYPLSGLALAWLGVRMVRTSSRSVTLFGAVAVVAGLLHAASVPLTLALPDAELTPVFAAAGMLISIWAIGTGASGLRASMRAGRADASQAGEVLVASSTGR